MSANEIEQTAAASAGASDVSGSGADTADDAAAPGSAGAAPSTAVPAADWIEHRRGVDGERLGWMRMHASDDRFDVIDLLGRVIARDLDWLDAEELLDETGIAYLAHPYELRLDGRWVRVGIVEVSPDRILVKTGVTGAIDEPYELHALGFPMPAGLRELGR